MTKRAQDIGASLVERAVQLRPSEDQSPARLVRMADELGIDIRLVLRPFDGRTRYDARCELRGRPKILVYRRSEAAGVAAIGPADEHLLTWRERFSVAHELGHCIAYKSLGVTPVSASEDRREYWRQEQAMNDFASMLLVPPWLSGRWTSKLSRFDATCVFRVRSWANDCGASPEVVVKALARDTPGIGFLKVGQGLRLDTNQRLLVVLHSASSDDVRLPNLFSHIQDSTLLNTITGNRGVAAFPRCRIGGTELDDVQLAWSATTAAVQSKRLEFQKAIRLSRVVYWICTFIGHRSHEYGQASLPF